MKKITLNFVVDDILPLGDVASVTLKVSPSQSEDCKLFKYRPHGTFILGNIDPGEVKKLQKGDLISITIAVK